jgi:hypothetical protein
MKKKEQNLQQHSTIISDKLIPITKTTDLLKAEPINSQILKYGRNEVYVEITKYLNKCIRTFDIVLDNNTIQVLVEDIVSKYKFDSIEDIRECLKKGRQGNYGKNYGKLNMVVISEWMTKHLEQKAIAREHQYNDKYKHNWKSKDEYILSVKEGLKEQDKKDQLKKRDDEAINEFNKFKAEYLKKAKPQGTINEKNR